MPKRASQKPAVKTSHQTSTAKQAKPSPQPTREDIERRAYEIYVERGGTEGSEMEDWLRAEQELQRRNRKVGH